MTVRELIELNQMIVDAQITVRKNGNALLDQLNIGLHRGIKPPFPTKVPKEERYIGNMSIATMREAYYIEKSINAWDDGKDYWQIKTDRIPRKWLDLEVYSWEVWEASTACGRCRRNDYGNSPKSVSFHGQRINITALPSGEHLEVKDKPKQDEQPTGQMDIFGYLESEG